MKTATVTARDLIQEMEFSSVMAETYTVKGYSVEVLQDDSADCPAEAWEGDCPAIWLGDDGFTEYGGASVESFFDRVTDAWVSRHWRAIAAIFGDSETTHDEYARAEAKATGDTLGGARSSVFIDCLHDMRAETWGRGIEYLETLRQLYRLAGIPAETFQRNGYSQGHSVYGLLVMTPEWTETFGAPHAKPGKIDQAVCSKDMAQQADTYGAWVWGDVYGFTVTAPNGEDLDSCFGFYGCDGKASGLFEAICSAINHHASTAATARAAKLKSMIRARAPLAARAAMLESFAC